MEVPDLGKPETIVMKFHFVVIKSFDFQGGRRVAHALRVWKLAGQRGTINAKPQPKGARTSDRFTSPAHFGIGTDSSARTWKAEAE